MKWTAIYTTYGVNYFDIEIESLGYRHDGLENFIRVKDALGNKILINKNTITHIEI